MFKRILVPLDGSLRAEKALKVVKFLNSLEDVELILLEVIDPLAATPLLYSHGDYRFDGHPIPTLSHERADGYLSSLLGHPTNDFQNRRAVIEYGAPHKVIVETAEREEVDLIVMVTHGYKGLDRILLGSITEKVIRNASCPVLALRDDQIPSNFLIATDSTPFCESMIEPTLELANSFNAALTLTHINQVQNRVQISDINHLATLDPGLYDRIQLAQSMSTSFYLDDLTEEIEEKTGVQVDYDLASGRPAEEILTMVENHAYDLIVMKTHGLKGIDRLLKGSVTEKVFRQGNSSMLIFHSND